MKKIYVKISILIIIIIIFLAGFTISNKFLAKNFDSLNTLDKEMFTELNTVYSDTKENELWKGFNLYNNPILLVNKGDYLNFKDNSINLIRKNVYAIGVKGLEDKWYAQKIEMPANFKLPPVYRLSITTPGILSTFNPLGNFSSLNNKISLGNSSNIFFFKYNSANFNNINKPSQEFVPFLTHELFHYSGQKKWKIGDGSDGNLNLKNKTKEWFELLGLEYVVLDKLMSSLTNSSNGALKEIISEYLVVEDARKKLDLNDFSKEKLHETIEGTANYVGIKASRLLKKPSKELKVLESIKEDKNRTFMNVFEVVLENPQYLEEIKWNRYSTGAILCFAIDKLYGSTGWQTKFNNTVEKNPYTLNDEIREYVKNNVDLKNISLDKIKKKYKFNYIKDLVNNHVK